MAELGRKADPEQAAFMRAVMENGIRAHMIAAGCDEATARQAFESRVFTIMFQDGEGKFWQLDPSPDGNGGTNVSCQPATVPAIVMTKQAFSGMQH